MPPRSRKARTPRSPWPSEQPHHTRPQHMQRRQELRSQKKPLLMESREPPFGFESKQTFSNMMQVKGFRTVEKGGVKKKVPTRGISIAEFDRRINSSDPRERAWAERQVLLQFNFYAARSIKSYFAANPNSKYTFEQIYSQMLTRVFERTLAEARELGGIVAAKAMYVRLPSGNDPSKFPLKNFEDNFLRKREVTGNFPISEARFRPIELRTPAEIDRYSIRELPPIKFEHLLLKAKLTPRERRILRLRYRDGFSQEKVANQFDLDRSRVSEIEHTVFQKLRDALPEEKPRRKKKSTAQEKKEAKETWRKMMLATMGRMRITLKPREGKTIYLSELLERINADKEFDSHYDHDIVRRLEESGVVTRLDPKARKGLRAVYRVNE